MSDILLRFVHISDTHISHNPDYGTDWARAHPNRAAAALVQRLNHLPFAPDFVLHTGDVAFEPYPEAYQQARDILSQIDWPVYYLAGNHDDAPMLQRELLQRTEITPEFYYDFAVNGVQIVCLDSTGPAAPPAGSVSAEQLAWLEGICTAGDPRPLVVAVHHNPPKTGVPWLDDYMGMTNGADLHAVLRQASQRLRGVFYGHIHQNSQTWRDGVLYSSVLSSWYQLHAWPDQVKTVGEPDAEPGFNVVTITRDQTHIRNHRYAVE
jgi:3',5'-cyclic-AMP phosphodiesterase